MLPNSTFSQPILEILLRLGLALVSGLLLGYERERHGRAAGLRTTMLVAVAAAMAMLLSQMLTLQVPFNSIASRADPARLAAGVLTGMGFLGAGSIVRQGSMVRGLTTAALLWYVTMLGLAFGSGYLLLGSIGLVLAAVALFTLPMVEKRIKNDWYSTLQVTLGSDGREAAEVARIVRSFDVQVQDWELDYDIANRQKTVRCDVKLKYSILFETSERIAAHFAALPDVRRVCWSEQTSVRIREFH